MNYLEITELVKRLSLIEEAEVYWKTNSFQPIESVLYELKRLDKEKEGIKFQLEFPYLVLKLLAEVEEIEGARVRVYKRQKDTAIGVNYKSFYHFILMSEATQEFYKELADFIKECKERKLHQDREDIQTALNKLTDREKELLNLTNLSDKNFQ